MTSAVPPLRPAVVDLASNSDVVAELHAALGNYGFVALRNCGIAQTLQDSAFEHAREFFNQPAPVKAQTRYTDPNANFGYQPVRSEALDPAIQPDLKEAFTMRALARRSRAGDAEWSHTPFGSVATQLYEACSATALNVLALLEQSLAAPSGSFVQHHTGENMTLRYLHYPVFAPTESTTAAADAASAPACTPACATGSASGSESDSAFETNRNIKKTPQLGAGAHTDYGTITLLFSDGVAGLQLFYPDSAAETDSSSGDWRDVEVADGDVLVNTGDLMALWSNGKYPSTLHRVQPRRAEPERYSMAFFVDPDSAARIAPLASCVTDARPAIGEPVIAGEHIQTRIEDSQRILANR